jgi:hypothetical protein
VLRAERAGEPHEVVGICGPSSRRATLSVGIWTPATNTQARWKRRISRGLWRCRHELRGGIRRQQEEIRMTRQDIINQGKTDGAAAVQAHLEEQGEESLIDAGPLGWSDSAAQAMVAPGRPRKHRRLQEVYYASYEKAARAEWKRAAAEIRQRWAQGEEPARGCLQEAA